MREGSTSPEDATPSAEEQQRIAAEKGRALRILNAKRAEVNNRMANILEMEEEMKERHRQQQEIRNKAKLAVEVKMEMARKLGFFCHDYGRGTTKRGRLFKKSCQLSKKICCRDEDIHILA